MENKVLVGVNELAKALGVKRSWVYQRTQLGKNVIPYIKVGRYLRFDVQEVLDCLKEKTN